MKTFFAFIVLVFTSVAPLRAQVLSEKISVEKHGYQYNGIYLDRYDIRKLLKKNDQAYKMLKPAKTNAGLGDFLLTAGIAFIAAPLYPTIGEDKENKNPKLAGTFIGIGAALTGISIPILRTARRQTRNAVEFYNSSLGSNLKQPSKTELQVGFTGRGPGLVVKF